MYRPPAFAVDDSDRLHAFIRERVFATLAVAVDGRVHLAYAPVVLGADGTTLRFHLARSNPLAAMADGTRVTMSFAGPDAYISPDWYDTPDKVPTWNYLAVEGQGTARRLDSDGLHQLLIDLSASEEAKLLPKKPWTIDKVPDHKMSALLNAIVGFEMTLETLEGKFKLSQNVTPEDFAGVLRGLESRDDPASAAVAREMRSIWIS